MSLLSPLGTSFGTLGVSVAGACVGGHITSEPGTGGQWDFSVLSIVPGALIGAVAAPTALHLLKPIVATVATQGLAAAAHQLPKLMAHGLFAALPYAGAAVLGVFAGANITGEDDAGSGYGRGLGAAISAIPGALVGVIVGPAAYSIAQATLGPIPGGAVCAATAFLSVKIRDYVRSRQAPR